MDNELSAYFFFILFFLMRSFAQCLLILVWFPHIFTATLHVSMHASNTNQTETWLYPSIRNCSESSTKIKITTSTIYSFLSKIWRFLCISVLSVANPFQLTSCSWQVFAAFSSLPKHFRFCFVTHVWLRVWNAMGTGAFRQFYLFLFIAALEMNLFVRSK